MKRALPICATLLAAAASMADAQLYNFPFYSLPTPGAAPSTFFVGSYGRGLNAESGEVNAYGVGVGRALGTRLTGLVGAGLVDFEPEARVSVGGAASAAFTPPGAASQVALQAGIGYISFAPDVNATTFPIGVAFRQRLEAAAAETTLWVMPRVQVTRASVLDSSGTETELGGSAGATLTTDGGLGLHAAVDLLASDPTVWLIGAGLHYRIE